MGLQSKVIVSYWGISGSLLSGVRPSGRWLSGDRFSDINARFINVSIERKTASQRRKRKLGLDANFVNSQMRTSTGAGHSESEKWPWSTLVLLLLSIALSHQSRCLTNMIELDLSFVGSSETYKELHCTK